MRKLMTHIIAPDIWHKDAVGNFCLDLAMLLRQTGHECALYAQHFSADETPEVADMEECFTNITPNDIIFLSYSIFDPYLDQIIALPNRKICYFHGVTPPELLEEFEPITAELCRKSQEQFAKLAQFDIVIANSHYTAKGLANYLSDKLINVSPPLFDTRQFASVPELAKKDENLFLCVGRIVPHKKIEDVMDILIQIQKTNPNAKLIIIGEGCNQSYNDFLQSEVIRLGLEKSIAFLGKVDDDALKEYYLKATGLINASMHEGYGIPVLEAMYYGVIPIVRSGNAMEEVVGDYGVVFEMNSLDSQNIKTHINSQKKAELQFFALATVNNSFSSLNKIFKKCFMIEFNKVKINI
jgi:glycosyltransferase involved in cell wall biosynthesis